MKEGAGVLGIDAGLINSETSGVALWRRTGSGWRCLRVAPSYASFCSSVDWNAPLASGPINVAALLKTCRGLLDGHDPAVVAVTIPLSHASIPGRRAADTAISTRFGHCQCVINRPAFHAKGWPGQRLHEGFKAAGYVLMTTLGMPPRALIEIYPPVALLGLMQTEKRLPYKIAKTKTYWPGLPLQDRRRFLVAQWSSIVDRLRQQADDVVLPLPNGPDEWMFSRLKRFEDGIDAQVSAWVGAQYLDSRAVRMGDAVSAIWIPQSALRYAARLGSIAYRKRSGADAPA